ncbi:hypothetical protein [Tautonia rosea]|uniref:hypothetical protein n=1 Tax=Tautonia rosea TaxID=2728037 RepID=UPI001474DBDF|nr:hypothetical protein [Tautonia rosea]
MNHEAIPSSGPSLPSRRGRGLAPAGLMRWVYTSNPFYVISAGLVFLGLRASFDARGPAVETGALMLGLAAYTLLLAATAVVLVRRGKVWDDVRTVLLLVVLMFLAISVAFDETLAGDPAMGRGLYLIGLGFALLVSEGILRGLGLELRSGFRVPYQAILALFFLYPIGLAPLVDRPNAPALMWALFGFAPVAGLLSLTLLPAIGRGPSYAEKNGSPWRWPLYPWVLFGLLGGAACARSYWLCVSFHFVMKDQTIFGPYFLVPFLLPCAFLVLELGRSARDPRAGRVVTTLALLAPLGLLGLAMMGHDRADPVYQFFLSHFREVLGATPAFLTLVLALPLYGWAIHRRVPGGRDGLCLALAALAVVRPTTLDLDSLSFANPWPLLVAALVQAVPAIRRWNAGRGILACAFLIASLTAALPDSLGGTIPWIVAAHLALLVMLGFGLIEGALGDCLRDLAVGLFLLFGLGWTLGAFHELFDRLGPIAVLYLPTLAALAAVYSRIGGGRAFLVSAGVLLGAWVFVYGSRSYLTLRRLVPGLDQILLGLLSFVVAALISLAKAGVTFWPGSATQAPEPPTGLDGS